METLEPLINLLTLLTALSLAAERITNLIKLGNTGLRVSALTQEGEKAREAAITRRGVFVGILLAVALKVDLVEVMRHADDPWQSIGWFSMEGQFWVAGAATDSIQATIAALLGCIATGCALGFGSKFWHELLDTLLELRKVAQSKTPRKPRAAVPPPAPNSGPQP
jgi:hypothetical protein